MINFTPINKKVRRTLAKRSEALVRDSVSDPFAPVSEDLISTTSRSIWVKMFSPVLVKKEGQLVEGARIFGDFTAKNLNKRLAVVLDGKVYSAPYIRERIGGGSGQISGNFTLDEAGSVAIALRSGALPARLMKSSS